MQTFHSHMSGKKIRREWWKGHVFPQKFDPKNGGWEGLVSPHFLPLNIPKFWAKFWESLLLWSYGLLQTLDERPPTYQCAPYDRFTSWPRKLFRPISYLKPAACFRYPHPRWKIDGVKAYCESDPALQRNLGMNPIKGNEWFHTSK